jgi:hypothetical protein
MLGVYLLCSFLICYYVVLWFKVFLVFYISKVELIK